MEEFLQCPICCVNYDNSVRVPRQLPCQHNLCSVCLPYMRKTANNQQHEYIECPMCREHFARSINDIPKSLVITQLIDTNRGTSNVPATTAAASTKAATTRTNTSPSLPIYSNPNSAAYMPSNNNSQLNGNSNFAYNPSPATSPPTYNYNNNNNPYTIPVSYNQPSSYSNTSNNKNTNSASHSSSSSSSSNSQRPVWNFRSYLKETFDEMDVNRDGSITASELQRALRRTQASSEFDMKTIQLLISKYDTNGDREISFEEFFDLFNNLNEEYETFLLTDADGSGFIDLHEFTEALKGKGYFFSHKFYEYIVNEICKRTKKPGIPFDIYIRVAARFDQLSRQYNLTLFYQKNSLENFLKKNFFDDFW